MNCSDLYESMENFKIAVVSPLPARLSKEERREILFQAHYNPFLLDSDQVLIDLLTDSGTGAISTKQLSRMMLGDESYAGSQSFRRLEKVVREFSGYKYILPVHQGRAAERLLSEALVKSGDIIPNNTHFDTTRANIMRMKGEAVNLLIKESDNNKKVPIAYPGNMDTAALSQMLAKNHHKVPYVVLTVTNNAAGGLPVSLANVEETAKICKEYGIPLFLDACRFAENCYYIKKLSKQYHDHSITKIAQKLFSFADGCVISAKKDGLSHIGGILALNDTKLYKKIAEQLIVTEGFLTYGGLTGRDMECMAEGFQEALDENYLKYRINLTRSFGMMLKDAGIPVVEPFGGHAVYIKAEEMLPHIPKKEYPAWALTCALYIEGGVRGVEIGGVMMDDKSDKEDLVRLAIPRRVYTESHLRYVANCLKSILNNREHVDGLKIANSPYFLRHFTAEFQPVAQRPFYAS